MKMRKWKKYVALLLALAMVASLTVTSLAETDDSDTIEGVVVEASESADVEVIDNTEDEEVSDADAVIEQTEDADAAETEVEAADVSEEAEEDTEDVEAESLEVSAKSVSALSSEDEDEGYFSYYYIECEDEDVLVNDCYYISREWSVYYYAEYYDEDTENWGCEDGYCEVESIEVSGPATYESDEDGYYIYPSESGEVTVTLYYAPASGVEDTEYNGEYTVTLNAVDETEGYFIDVSSDTDYLLPGGTATVDATVYHWTNSNENGYEESEYDGEVTYVWEINDWDDVLESYSGMGASYILNAQDSLDVDEGLIDVWLDVYGEDGELLACESYSIYFCNEYYELELSEDSYYLTEGDTVEVKPTLYLCTASGRTAVTSGVTYYIDSDSMRGSWSWSGDDEINLDDIFCIDEMNIEVYNLPSGLSYAQVIYDVVAEIDGESVAETSVTASVDGPTVYEYYYPDSNQDWMVGAEFYVSKEYSVSCSIETWNQEECDYTYENLAVYEMTAVTDSGKELDVIEDDDNFIIIPEEEGTVTITLYYDQIDGSDDSGEYSFDLYVTDTVEGYYLYIESDNNNYTIIPGQSINLTASYIHYIETTDGYDEEKYDGIVEYDWYIDSCYPEDGASISWSDNECVLTADESSDEDDAYIMVCVDAYDENGDYLGTESYYCAILSEYYVLSLEEDTFSLEPGDAVEMVPSLIYYSAENLDGVDVTDEAEYTLGISGYYLLGEDTELWIGGGDEEDLQAVGVVDVNSDSLVITVLESQYTYAEVYLYMYADIAGQCIYSENDILVSVTYDSEVQECEHTNLTYHEAVDPTCTTNGNKEYWGCNDCGLMFSDSDVTDVISESEVIIPATGHSYVKLSTDVQDATCTEDGMITTKYECEYCGDSYEKTETIPSTGHVWNEEAEWTWTDDYSTATATFTCDVCGVKSEVDADITPEETEDGITYTAVATLDNVSATNEKSVSIASEVTTGDTQASVAGSVDEAYQGIAADVAASVDVDDALENVAEELSDAVDYEKVLEQLAEEGITVDETSEVTITTETYLQITVLKLEIDEENQTAVLTIDISMCYTVTASVGNDSVIVDEGKVIKTIWDPIAVTIDVTGIPFADADSIYVKHNASDGTYYYKASYDESAQTITFTNPHGFSEFTVSVDSRTATVYYSDLDETASYTPAEVSSALPTASKSGYTFNGWTFDGVEGTYTTLTDDLLTALSALGVDKVTATASFTEIVSEDTTDTDSEKADNTKDNNAGDNTTADTDSTTDSSSAATTSASTTATGDYNTTGLWVMLVLAGAVAVYGVIRRRSSAR